MKIRVSRSEAKTLINERITSARALIDVQPTLDFFSAFDDFKRSLDKWRSYNGDLLARIYGPDSKAVVEYQNKSSGAFLLFDQGIQHQLQGYQQEVQDEVAYLESCIDRLSLYDEPVSPPQSASPKAKTGLHEYVDKSRIQDLKALKSYDSQKLIRLCEELNIAFRNECFLATVMLLRAILDHVPPLFAADSFTKVANNYAGSKSFKESMTRLESSSRKIADSHLHTQIRAKESLPNAIQVDFSNDLDVLLGEIVRIGF